MTHDEELLPAAEVYNLILADKEGTILLAPDPRLLGQRLSEEALIAWVPINAGGSAWERFYRPR